MVKKKYQSNSRNRHWNFEHQQKKRRINWSFVICYTYFEYFMILKNTGQQQQQLSNIFIRMDGDKMYTSRCEIRNPQDQNHQYQTHTQSRNLHYLSIYLLYKWNE
ncbi:hypothetical protein DERF_012493 [Dermatophagoides farinae]|uniref:Uncharacterized protein n=1 Tax=Dermatophagoides farinae TaxID=6954 RepID=A0A922HPN9_DERFA|nr:hypothetical protein DERF_012493 [Dermatophagoides farinae]